MNVYKHADTKAAELCLKKEKGTAVLVVADMGNGFDLSYGVPWNKDQNELGLLSMKERVEAVGGILEIQAGINQGCRVEAKVPIHRGNFHVKD